ncbi:EcoAI/FtnUII family type I restriction enzme subunit R [Micromonospora sp. S-DT3-3-22]|uniref:EcoAI/FtnUII family type I restriction enzme subunit R n=1 Tax=Micromonospora sp. S-DT3-3-22 TaxID=2755359 RepID=UPI00188E4219|nr:DEAD/DEAH box helicase family protein [Micromonospora sp. S-DT3-3-22]
MTFGAARLTEDETCKWFVLPALAASGWPEEQIWPQYPINAGKLVATTRRHSRQSKLKADYVLEHRDGLPIGIVEAKRTSKNAADGIEQAKRYARLLDVPFAYATNGRVIHEIDLSTGLMTEVGAFPSPETLLARYRQARGLDRGLQTEVVLMPFDQQLRNFNNTPREARYYQKVAVNRAVHAITRGDKRILLTLATGTGKTLVAYLIVAKLRRAEWTGGRPPRVLYLADRSMLIDQPKDEYFIQGFGDVVHKIERGVAARGRDIYFALYQTLDRGNDQPLYKRYDSDYFDLIIVDECHRGSARDEAQWSKILKYFSPSTQIGMTATPINKRDADTYNYFGDPVYEYSLAQGIEDGYLAPYRVRKARLNVDIMGWRPTAGQRDIYGNEIPDRLYTPKDHERVLAILERTEEAAAYLTNYLRETDRLGKTIVFCENNDHAHRMRQALTNANYDMVQRYPDYVCRITDDDGDPGRALLDRFKKIDTDEPVIAVTSRLLTTGVDMPSVRNIVLFRRIGSMPEFKQIIGRGTRVCEDVRKSSFDIIDFVEATVLFNDPTFDGPPIRIVRDDVDDEGSFETTIEQSEADEDLTEEAAGPGSDYQEQDGNVADKTAASDGPANVVDDPDQIDNIRANGVRLYVNGVDVFVWGEAFYVLEGDGRRLRLVTYRQYVQARLIELDLDPANLRAQWAIAKSRRLLSEALEAADIPVSELPVKLQHPEVDPIDLLLHIGWEFPLVSRDERVARLRREHRDFLAGFPTRAREILDLVLEKYAAYGPSELSPSALQVPPFTEHGTIIELAERFNGGDKLHEALDNLGTRLFSVAA